MRRHFLSGRSHIISLKIVIIYAVFGFLWVFFADMVIGIVFGDRRLMMDISFLKGCVLVVITATLLYFFIRRAEHAAAKSTAREQLLSNNMIEAVFVHAGAGLDGLPGNFIEVNDAACERLGYTRHELLKMRPSDIDDPATLANVSVVMAKLKEQGFAVWEGMHVTKQGNKIPVEISTRTFDMDGQSYILSIARDITERKKTQEQLKVTNRHLEDIIEFLPDATIIIDKDKKIIAWNRAIEEMTGVPKKDMLGKDHLEASIPFYGKPTPYLADLVFKKDEEVPARYGLLKHKGSCLFGEAFAASLYNGQGAHIWAVASPLYDSEGNISAVIESIRDVTEKKVAEEALAKEHNLLRTLIDNLPDSVYVKDREGRKILTNRSDLDFIGAKSESDVIGKTDAEVYPKYLADQYGRDDHSVLRNGRLVINREELVEDALGIKHWLLTSKIPLRDTTGGITGLVGIGRDITDRKILENKLLTMAHYDALTALPNRTLFLEKANLALAHDKRAAMQCALLFVDLDHFKSVNDTLGHSVGDELLKDTALKLAECVRETIPDHPRIG